MSKIIGLALIVILTSCASYQTGKEVKDLSDNKQQTRLNTKQEIKMTAKLNRELSTKHFSFIQIDFGNKSDNWIDISKFNLLADEKIIKVILGNKYNE